MMISYHDYTVSGGRVTDESESIKHLEGNGHGLIEVLSQHLSEGNEENYKAPVRTARVPVEI
jgi:hypothetical protein